MHALRSVFRSPVWRRLVLPALFASSPLVAGAALLGTLRPIPAGTAADTELIVHGNDGGDVAALFPGRAAIALAGLPFTPRFDRLPFDVLVLDDAALERIDPTVWGYRRFGEERAGIRYRRQPLWSVLDRWDDWNPVAWHDDDLSTRMVCPFRTTHGGWGCGRRVELAPEIHAIKGELWGVLAVSSVPAGTHVELTAHSPAALEGHLVPLQSAGAPPAVIIRRAGAEHITQCSELCRLSIPEGDGPIILRFDGPNTPLAIDLRQRREDG